MAAVPDTLFVTPEELLAGSSVTFDVEIPAAVLTPDVELDASGARERNAPAAPRKVRLRPLTVKDIQLIARAAKDDEVLTSVLMIQKSLVEPPLKQPQIQEFHGGLVSFLVERINRISGLATTESELQEIAGAPIVQAFFLLAKEFHWTPTQVRELTLGQVLGYLEFLNKTKRQA
jgi:hypothetical protein